MHIILEILMVIFVEWLFLLPSKFLAVFRGEKFTYKSFTAKDYYVAIAFWAVVTAITVLVAKNS